MSVFFGTDGLRGVVGEELTYDIAFKCGNSLSQNMQGGRVLIGRDTRVTGSFLVSALACGLLSGGVDVVDAGIIPTAAVAYLTKSFKFDYGISITASHNPMQYNGIKIFSLKGEKLQDKEEEKIERGFIKSKHVSAEKIGLYVQKTNLRKYYIDYLVNTANGSLSGLKVVLDASNGASYSIAPEVFRKLGAKVIKTSCMNNGLKINDKCGSLHPERLAKKVKQYGADMGFAFDGDADRLIAVSEKGKIIDGDMILYALALVFKQRGMLVNNAVVGTSQTNMGIELSLKEKGIKLLRADVGDKYVANLLNKNGLVLGGEQSGHIIIKKFMQTGDGILTAILLAHFCKESGKPLSEFCKVRVFPQVNKDIVVKEKLRILGSEALLTAITNAQQELAGLGRVLVRASGTEPKIRIMVESENIVASQSLANYLLNTIEKLEAEAVEEE